jgi:hypothetical protein
MAIPSELEKPLESIWELIQKKSTLVSSKRSDEEAKTLRFQKNRDGCDWLVLFEKV